MSTYFKKGSWNVICDVCGFEYKSHEVQRRWDGLMVCKEDWEARHELDFYRIKPEKPPIPWAKPDNDTVTYPLIFINNYDEWIEWRTDIDTTLTWYQT